jgi:uncharacterized C2H2 Zn-finger protein
VATDEEGAIMQREQEAPREGAICGTCGASFETQEELDRHVASEHGEGETRQEERRADR